MIIIVKANAPAEKVEAIVGEVRRLGFSPHPSVGEERTIIGVVGHNTHEYIPHFQAMEWVERVVPILKPYKLVAREARPERTRVQVGQATFGSETVVVIAGPCTVETEEQVLTTAHCVKAAGGHLLRGGAFKPRTSPHTFMGHGEEGLRILAAARAETGLPVVTEVMDARDIDLVCQYADMLQVGARNMQNFTLLREIGRAPKPVLLKRGMSSTLEEFLLAAEYVVNEGNQDVVLCERGIRTFETYTRNTFDINALAAVHELSHLPIIADPSHATGRSSLVADVALGAIASGADGIMVEVHPRPEEAITDGPQALTFSQFEALMARAKRVAEAVGRRV